MTQLSPELVLEAHKIVADFAYERPPVERGYANRTLYINLDEGKIQSKPVTQKMKDLFTGGRGFAMWLLWNAVADGTAWDDPSNELILAGGVIGGITGYPGSGKMTAVTISPLTHSIIDSNGGGYFGPYLKFAGWDALEIQGKAENDVIIFIDGDNGRVTVEEAPLEPVDTHLVARLITEIYGTNDRERRGISVVSA
ncbi:aldehyde:ferredoxin oxidoreductase, partial [bacterium]|nr:aldehyde:ferredoxin oxidoreductase [bacterium]